MADRLLPWIVALLATLPVLVARFPPIQDLPAQAALIQHLAHPAAGSVYESAGPFAHGWAFYLAGAALAQATDAWTAARLLAALAAAALPLATLLLARALGSDRRFALAAAGLAWNQVLVLGFVPFALSMSAALAGTALVVRQPTALRAFGAAAVATVATWYLHSMGVAALALGVLLLVPGRRRVAALAGLAPSIALFLLSRSGGASLVGEWTFDAIDDRLVNVLLVLGPASRLRLPDLLPLAIPGAALLLIRRGWADAGRERRLLVVAALVLGGLSLVLPDHLSDPPLVLAHTRFLPFIAALLAAAVPSAPPRWTAAVLVAAALSLAWTAVVFRADGERSRPAAEPLCAMEPGHRLFNATLHRPAPGTLLTSYVDIHLPFLYQACGQGETLGPFTHAEMPVRLRADPARALHDAARSSWVADGVRWCDRLVTDGGDVPRFLEVTHVAELPACPEALPAPWLCRELR
jgi:hypothetical protein